MSRLFAQATAAERFAGPRSATDADPLAGMLEDLEAHPADCFDGPREVGGGGSPHDEQPMPPSATRLRGAPRGPDAIDGLIELAGMLDPEDWLGALRAKARG